MQEYSFPPVLLRKEAPFKSALPTSDVETPFGQTKGPLNDGDLGGFGDEFSRDIKQHRGPLRSIGPFRVGSKPSTSHLEPSSRAKIPGRKNKTPPFRNLFIEIIPKPPTRTPPGEPFLISLPPTKKKNNNKKQKQNIDRCPGNQRTPFEGIDSSGWIREQRSMPWRPASERTWPG